MNNSLGNRLIGRLATSNALNAFATWRLPAHVPVFMLHRLADPARGIEGTDPNYLRRCLQYLQQNNYEFISIEDAIEHSLNKQLARKKWVAFSLDDGFDEQVNVAGPIFQEFNCPATCFLITGFVDGKLWPWDYQLMYLASHTKRKSISISIHGQPHQIELGIPGTQDFLLALVRKFAAESAYEVVKQIADAADIDLPSTPPDNMLPTNWNDVRKMEQRGMRFAAHSVSHRILASLNNDELKQELLVSKERIAAECAHPEKIFCYPSGKAHEFDERAINIAKQLGFTGALSAEPGYLDAGKILRHANYRYGIPRMTLPENFEEFKRYVSWLQNLRERMASSPLEKFFA